jgi:hypothetical protein
VLSTSSGEGGSVQRRIILLRRHDALRCAPDGRGCDTRRQEARCATRLRVGAGSALQQAGAISGLVPRLIGHHLLRRDEPPAAFNKLNRSREWRHCWRALTVALEWWVTTRYRRSFVMARTAGSERSRRSSAIKQSVRSRPLSVTQMSIFASQMPTVRLPVSGAHNSRLGAGWPLAL